MRKRDFNLPNVSTAVNKNLRYDPNLKPYEQKFITQVLEHYESAGQIRVVLDAGLALGFLDFATQRHVVVASELIPKKRACELLGYDEASTEYFTDDQMVRILAREIRPQ